jgi:transposase-like protein
LAVNESAAIEFRCRGTPRDGRWRPTTSVSGKCRLKAIYRAETAETAAAELEAFEAEWGKHYPAIGQAWRRAWEYVVPPFAFPPAIRKVIYTTNAVESLHRSLRKIHQDAWQLPNRRSGAETAISGDPQCWR